MEFTHQSAREINRIVKDAIRAKLDCDHVDVRRTGFWWCAGCQHITEPNCDGPQNTCGICKSPRIKWNPPLMSVNEVEMPRDGAGRFDAHAAFDQIRAAIEQAEPAPTRRAA